MKKKPTEIQVSYAKFISRKCGIELPKEYTYEAYFNFIIKYKDKLKGL